MPAQVGSMYPLIMMAIVVGFFYFFAIRPQKKREREIAAMRAALKVGDRVTTIGGIRGRIVKIGEEYLTLETSNEKTRLEMTKWAIGSVEDPAAKDVAKEVKPEPEEVVEEETVE